MQRVAIIDWDDDHRYQSMFVRNGYTVVFNGVPLDPREIGDCDIVCFTGGEDVDPSLYGQENISSFVNKKRDEVEVSIFKSLSSRGPQPPSMVGICRGGQLLNVLTGGKMIQHVRGHSMGKHKIKDLWTGREFEVLGDHHQAMIPADDRFVVALEPETGVNEVIFYPRERRLCFQPHPEWSCAKTEEYFFELLNVFDYSLSMLDHGRPRVS